jgi:hypothetical protein
MQIYTLLGNINKILRPNSYGYQTVIVSLPKTQFAFRCSVSPQNTYYLEGCNIGDPILVVGYPMWKESDEGIVLDYIKVSTVSSPKVAVDTAGFVPSIFP